MFRNNTLTLNYLLIKALSYVNEAIEIISKPENKIDGKPKYGFLIYNASICVYEIVRPMLRMNW